ncbi:MAG: hypothetical protein AB7H70_13290 [Rhodospirillaceae bacterium]
MPSKRRLVVFLVLAGLNAAISPFQVATAAEDRLYCLSDVCPGDTRSVLSTLTLSNLGHIAERPRARAKEYQDAFKAAIPGLSDAERLALSAYADSRGSLLLDARTLPIFLKIGRICAPVGPFVALFTSESGHVSVIEFGATIQGSEVQLGVTRVARSYQVKAESAEEKALLADLSRRFGFRIDAAPEKHLAGRDRDVTAQFTRQEKGFVLAFSGVALRQDAAEFAAQTGCDRIKID